MATKNKQYSPTEARQIISDYIDESAKRLSLRLKKAYVAQKKQPSRVRSYA